MAGKPHRVQLRRTRGWRMPPNTVSVSRPGPWGNPYAVGVHGDAAQCVQLYRGLVARFPSVAFTDLRGKNLACWCALDKPCHADVLLEIANGG